MIDARNISLTRNGRPILDSVDFSARSGSLTAILGANGAGKSSLMKILAGDILPDGGSVRFLQRPLHDWQARELAQFRAVVPQSSALNFPFRVVDVVAQGIARRACDITTKRPSRQIAAALQAVDLLSMASRDYLTLSGGERQRVHIARALAQLGEGEAGRLLLLDEPTASLDLRHGHEILRFLRRMADEGACIVIVMHDLNLCSQYADRVLLLHYGRVCGMGDTAAVMTSDWLEMAYGLPIRRFEAGGRFHFSAQS